MGLRPDIGIPGLEAEQSDLSLVRECQAGRASAWRALYDAHYGFVFRVARRMGTPAEESEDVVHEVLMVVLKKIDQFQGGRFTTWLYRITANVVSYRHRKRRLRRTAAEIGWGIAPPTPPTPEALSTAASDARAVERILERMSPKKRAVFTLFELEGLSGDEIAELEGCPVNTVWSRLRHAREDFSRIGRKMGFMEVVP